MRQIVFFLFCVLATETFAQNTLTIHHKDGRDFNYGFSERPVITYTETDLVLTTTNIVVEYPLSALSKFTFTDVDLSVSNVDNEIISPKLVLKEYAVYITGAMPEQIVYLLGVDGKIIATYKTDINGTVTFNIESLHKGVYVIKTNLFTCKISKK
jgi:hypothetical protein